MTSTFNRTPYPPGPPTPHQPPQQPKNAPHKPNHGGGGYFSLPLSSGSHGGTPSTPPPQYRHNSYYAHSKLAQDTNTPQLSPALSDASIDFTYSSDIGLENVPASVTGETVFNQVADHQHHDFAFTYEAGARGQQKTSAQPDSDFVVAVALEGADQESLQILRWAAKEVAKVPGTLVIIRAVKRPEGFRGNYSRAADLMGTVEARAKAEAEQLVTYAAKALRGAEKDQVRIVVKYRVGEHRERIRQILEEVRPTKLVVGSNKRRIGTRFHHGKLSDLLPTDVNVEIVTAPEAPSTPGHVGTPSYIGTP